MNIFYAGVDVTNDFDVKSAIAIDCEGGTADNIRLRMSDAQRVWSAWDPKEGDRIRITEGQFDSGIMYLDDIELTQDECSLAAVSLDPTVRVEHWQSWEEITFRRLLADFADRYELELRTYDIPNVTYGRITQHGNCDLEWLKQRCMLEGCSLKIHDGKLVVYDEHAFEQKNAVKEIELTDNTPYKHRKRAWQRRSACTVISGVIRGHYEIPGGTGPALFVDQVAAGSIAEARRFARGILRSRNKAVETLLVQQALDAEYAAGECVQVSGAASIEGKWFMSAVRHDLIGENSRLSLRRPLGW